MHRLTRLLTLTVLFTLTVFSAPLVRRAAADETTRPNIVIIMADDMGYSDIGCYGGEINTPSLDRLAEHGLRFTQFYNTGRCCPTRASLLTGLYPHQAGIGWMMSDNGYDGYRGDLNENCVTIAEVLKRSGYATYMSGKWHVTRHIAPEGPKHNWPRQRGFDRFYGTISGAGSFYDPYTLARDNTQIAPDQEDYYYTDAISDNAIQFIDEHNADQPFFLYVAYTAPHWPMHAPQEDIVRYSGRYNTGWDALRAERYQRMLRMGLIDDSWELSPRTAGIEPWPEAELKPWHRRRMEVYAAMVDRMDFGIGRILKKLEEEQQFDNTLILFLADNGGCAEEYGSRGSIKPPPAERDRQPAMGENELQTRMQPTHTRDGWPVRTGRGVEPGPADTYIAYGEGWANASNTPFRLYKHYVHEGGISTPLIAHWPEGIQRHGQFERQPGHLIDLMATCVDVAEAEYPQELNGQPILPMEGRSLRPAFAGETIDREALYWEHEGNRAIRQGKWKLVARGEDGPWELYDLSVDRSELHDLTEQFPERVDQMADAWEAFAERANVYPLRPYANRGKLNREQLEFELNTETELARPQAPYLVGRSIWVQLTVQPDGEVGEASQGALLAQGGTAHGFALYLQEGQLRFATRHAGKLRTYVSEAAVTAGQQTIRLEYPPQGKLRVWLNEQLAIEADSPGSLVEMPQDGLQVGRDENGAVGDYTAPFVFAGTVAGTLRLREKGDSDDE